MLAQSTKRYTDEPSASDALEHQPFSQVMNDVTDYQLQQGLIQRSFGGGGGAEDWLKSQARQFFSDESNLPWAKSFMVFYNRGIPGYNDTNWWEDQYKFFVGVKYFKAVNFNINPTPADCQSVNDQELAVQRLIASAIQDQATGANTGRSYDLSMEILKNMDEFLVAKFGALNCQQVMTDQEQSDQLATVIAAADMAAGSTEAKSTDYVKYGIYAIGAIMVIAALTMLFGGSKK